MCASWGRAIHNNNVFRFAACHLLAVPQHCSLVVDGVDVYWLGEVRGLGVWLGVEGMAVCVGAYPACAAARHGSSMESKVATERRFFCLGVCALMCC
jgi:hypothetical protein